MMLVEHANEKANIAFHSIFAKLVTRDEQLAQERNEIARLRQHIEIKDRTIADLQASLEVERQKKARRRR